MTPKAGPGDERPDPRDMLAIHAVFRRELRSAAPLVAATASGDPRRARLVARHLLEVLDFLDDHHHGEDAHLWPLLERRARSEQELDPTLLARMARQHAELARCVERLRPLLRGWVGDPGPPSRQLLADELAAAHRLVRGHLDDEESHVLPLVERHLSVEEWNRLAEHGRASTPRRPAVALRRLGMIVEQADPAQRAIVLGGLPPVVRLIWRTCGVRAYARHVRRLRGATERRCP